MRLVMLAVRGEKSLIESFVKMRGTPKNFERTKNKLLLTGLGLNPERSENVSMALIRILT